MKLHLTEYERDVLELMACDAKADPQTLLRQLICERWAAYTVAVVPLSSADILRARGAQRYGRIDP